MIHDAAQHMTAGLPLKSSQDECLVKRMLLQVRLIVTALGDSLFHPGGAKVSCSPS